MNQNMEAKSELKYIFANVNEWLKFAEAKHGGLVVLNAGLVVGILSSYSNIQNFTNKTTLLIGMICFGISVFISIISQFPVTQNLFYNKKDIAKPNLYFFGNLSCLDNNSFIAEYQRTDIEFKPTKFDTDLINQILVNSRITQSKFTLFKIASYITAFGSGLIGLTTIIKVIWHF
jgi:hypothetical protein